MKSPFMKAVVGAAVILTSPIVTFAADNPPGTTTHPVRAKSKSPPAAVGIAAR